MESNLLSLIIFAPLAGAAINWFLGRRVRSERFIGAVMASDYNSRPQAAEVMVEGGRWAVVRPRIEPATRFADERLPEWLTAAQLEREAAG
jgi:hypothetical protein